MPVINIDKSSVKRHVFQAHRNTVCESGSLILTGRLFQMSGPYPRIECALLFNCELWTFVMLTFDHMYIRLG